MNPVAYRVLRCMPPLVEYAVRHAYGEGYRAYRRSGVPFFVPRPRRGARDTAASP